VAHIQSLRFHLGLRLCSIFFNHGRAQMLQ
jgi:hypothetical protein